MWVFASLLLLCISLLFFFGAPQLSWSVNFRRIRMSVRYVFMFGFLQNVFCNSQYPALSSLIDTQLWLFSSDLWMCALVFVMRCVVYVAHGSQRDDLNPCEQIIPVLFFL